MEVPAPASLQPLPDLSLAPPADTPEAAFDMIAAANLQPEPTPELDSTPDPETEEPAAADPDDKPEEKVDLDLPGEQEEEIPLEEVSSSQHFFMDSVF